MDRLFVYAGFPPTYSTITARPPDAEPVEVDRRWHQVIDALVSNSGR